MSKTLHTQGLHPPWQLLPQPIFAVLWLFLNWILKTLTKNMSCIFPRNFSIPTNWFDRCRISLQQIYYHQNSVQLPTSWNNFECDCYSSLSPYHVLQSQFLPKVQISSQYQCPLQNKISLPRQGKFTGCEIGRAHVWTPVTPISRMPSSAWKKKKTKRNKKKQKKKKQNKKKQKTKEWRDRHRR